MVGDAPKLGGISIKIETQKCIGACKVLVTYRPLYSGDRFGGARGRGWAGRYLPTQMTSHGREGTGAFGAVLRWRMLWLP